MNRKSGRNVVVTQPTKASTHSPSGMRGRGCRSRGTAFRRGGGERGGVLHRRVLDDGRLPEVDLAGLRLVAGDHGLEERDAGTTPTSLPCSSVTATGSGDSAAGAKTSASGVSGRRARRPGARARRGCPGPSSGPRPRPRRARRPAGGAGGRRRTRPTPAPRAWCGSPGGDRRRAGRRRRADHDGRRREDARAVHVGDELGDVVVRGSDRICSAVPICTIRPSRMTAIRSPRCIASLRSCVMKTIVLPSVCWSSGAAPASRAG